MCVCERALQFNFIVHCVCSRRNRTEIGYKLLRGDNFALSATNKKRITKLHTLLFTLCCAVLLVLIEAMYYLELIIIIIIIIQTDAK